MRRTIIGAILALLVCNGYSAAKISDLNDSSLYKISKTVGKNDPLKSVAEEIRKQIDPTKKVGWPDSTHYKAEYVDYIKEIHDSYKEFWKNIPASSRIYIDLDHDGVMEYFVISNGLNMTSWGFNHFFTVLKRVRDDNYKLTDKWKIIFFHKFDLGPAVTCDGITGGKLRGFQLLVTDLDRDTRPDILFTTTNIGGSASCRYLNVISMHPDMKIRYYNLWTRKPIEILNKDAIRPTIIQYEEDRWGKDDCGVTVRGRGSRKSYYHWTVKRGFYEF